MTRFFQLLYLAGRQTLTIVLQLAFATFYITLYYVWQNPRMKRRIGLREYPGTSFDNGLWCIYAVRVGNAVSKNLITCLTCLQRAGYNVILVNNGRLSDRSAAACLPYCHTVIARPYGGRDFGGYKWGTQFLADLGDDIQVEQVIYCNDSIFLRPSSFAQLLDRMKQSNQDYIGMTETFEIHYHVQSWFFAISGQVFRSKYFSGFWINYKSYSHRRHCINNGEVKLSKFLINRGVMPHLLYTQSAILDAMFEGTLDKSLSRLMMYFRPHEYRKLTETIEHVAFAHVAGTQLATSFVKRKVLEELAMANTMHYVNLILLEFTTFPFLKKDLVHRAQYFVSQVDYCLANWSGVDADELPEILAYFRYRDSLRWQHSLSAMLARLGVA
jgi:hypothetical protein